MNLERTPLLIETVVPVNWTAKPGIEHSGLIRLGRYPAGAIGVRAAYADHPEGRKFAKAHAWRFLQPVSVGRRKVRAP